MLGGCTAVVARPTGTCCQPHLTFKYDFVIGHHLGLQLFLALAFLVTVFAFCSAPMSGWSSAGVPVVLIAKAKPSPKSAAQNRSQRPLAFSSSVPPIGPLSAAVSRGRSRSPDRAALPALRSDGPGRLDRRFAGLPRVLSEEERAAAIEALDSEILAATTQRTNAARLKTISSALALWGIPMWPPTAVSFKALAATLKLGRYASAATFFRHIGQPRSVRALCLTTWLFVRLRIIHAHA